MCLVNCLRRQMKLGPHHEPSHPLLLNSLSLLLLLTLRVGVPVGHGSGELLDFARHRAVIFFKVFCVLKDAVEILLKFE